jgi:hypothetical protein
LGRIHGLGSTEDVAGGQVARAEVGAEQFRLGALPYPGGPEQNQATRVLNVFRTRFTTSLRAAQPRFSISLQCHNKIVEKARDSPETHYANNRQDTQAKPELLWQIFTPLTNTLNTEIVVFSTFLANNRLKGPHRQPRREGV